MKLNRLTILVTILIAVSLVSNLNSFLKPNVLWSSAVLEYNFDNMFEGGVMLYRPRGTDAIAVFDLSDSVVEVKFNKLLNCASIRVVSIDGQILSPCIRGTPE